MSGVGIKSRDYWFKVVDFLQQNWALIDEADGGAVVWFIGDRGGVFDQIKFPSVADAIAGLERNGFSRFANDADAQTFITAPEPPFWLTTHPGGRIYASGKFWRS